MEDLVWLDRFTGNSLEELLALADEHSVDSLVVALGEALVQKANKSGERSLTEEERVVIAVEALEVEVNNGGYSQFFTNASREFIPIIVESLLQIGCEETSSITKRAIEAIGVDELTPHAIEEAFVFPNDARDAELEECDQLYFETRDDIPGQLFEYVRANQDEIRPWET